jgi:hypothetical protein
MFCLLHFYLAENDEQKLRSSGSLRVVNTYSFGPRIWFMGSISKNNSRSIWFISVISNFFPGLYGLYGLYPKYFPVLWLVGSVLKIFSRVIWFLGYIYIYTQWGWALFYMAIPPQINLFTEKLQKKKDFTKMELITTTFSKVMRNFLKKSENKSQKWISEIDGTGH